MLELVVAGSPTDRVAALRDGRVVLDGVVLDWRALPVEEIFGRMFAEAAFDVAELSLAGYAARRARGEDALVAIPVFLSRSFRHNIVYVHADAGISRPEDLVGRRVGIPEYAMTAAVWLRGMLEDDHGVRPTDLEWIQGGVNVPGRRQFEPVRPPGVRITPAPEGRTLADMLAGGELDGLVTPRAPVSYRAGDGPVRRLFADPAAEARAYFARTGIFPIMHLVALRRELVEGHPWLPAALLEALERAKALAVADLRDTTVHHATLPFLPDHVAETAALMGEDFWPYGLEANRHTLATYLTYMHRQGLLARPLTPDELFWPGHR